MNKEKEILVSLDHIDREEKGYSNISDEVLQCGDCGKSLVVIKKVKETTEQNKFKAICDFCGGSSFVKTITGKTYISGLENTNLVDIKAVNQVNIIYIKANK